MGNQSSSCSKYQKKSKTPPKHQKIPPLSPNLNQKPLNYKQSQLILDRKAIPQNSIFDDFEKRYQEIKETINFISNVLEFRDTTEVFLAHIILFYLRI